MRQTPASGIHRICNARTLLALRQDASLLRHAHFKKNQTGGNRNHRQQYNGKRLRNFQNA